jgi:protoheme ferro-lyase
MPVCLVAWIGEKTKYRSQIMGNIIWASLFAVFFGIFFAGFLTSHPLKMVSYLLAACFALAMNLVVLAIGLPPAGILWGIGASVLAMIAGYLGMARVVLSREDQRPVPELTRSPDDPGLGHTAVVYFTHGEPETFDPIGWINQFREFDEQKIPFVPFFARPFFIYNLRKKYLNVGKSDHRSTHMKMIRSLEECFRREGDITTRFYLSFLDDNPRPDAAVIQALNDGASRIIVSEVFLTDSNHTSEGKEQIASVLKNFPNIPTRTTGPLHDSLTLQRMFLDRANRNNSTIDKGKIGILLVGHGQPDEWDREWPTETAQEIGFRLDVLKHFEADGYKKENISLAWMEFKEPKPAEKIAEFIKNDVQELLYFPAAISADSIHSQFDIPELVHKAKVPQGFPMKNLGAWNDDPQAICAIKEKIDAALANFPSAQ